MRIVGGIYRGRTLAQFERIGVRPTSDKAREALFNILQFKISDALFLDLFAGTGAVGIEALSRGAKGVVLNDSARDSVKLIKLNLAKLKIPESSTCLEGATVSQCDGLFFLKNRTGINTAQFDIIYIDPPYGTGLIQAALPYIAGALADGGVAVVEDEIPFDEGALDLSAHNLKITDKRKYGRAHLTFFAKESE